MKYIIDRFEKDIAVLEQSNGTTIDIQISLLPEGSKEGDSLVKKNGKYVVDKAETSKRKNEIQKLFDELLNK